MSKHALAGAVCAGALLVSCTEIKRVPCTEIPLAHPLGLEAVTIRDLGFDKGKIAREVRDAYAGKNLAGEAAWIRRDSGTEAPSADHPEPYLQLEPRGGFKLVNASYIGLEAAQESIITSTSRIGIARELDAVYADVARLLMAATRGQFDRQAYQKAADLQRRSELVRLVVDSGLISGFQDPAPVSALAGGMNLDTSGDTLKRRLDGIDRALETLRSSDALERARRAEDGLRNVESQLRDLSKRLDGVVHEAGQSLIQHESRVQERHGALSRELSDIRLELSAIGSAKEESKRCMDALEDLRKTLQGHRDATSAEIGSLKDYAIAALVGIIVSLVAAGCWLIRKFMFGGDDVESGSASDQKLTHQPALVVAGRDLLGGWRDQRASTPTFGRILLAGEPPESPRAPQEGLGRTRPTSPEDHDRDELRE